MARQIKLLQETMITAPTGSYFLVLGRSHSKPTQDRVSSAFTVSALPGYTQPLYPFPCLLVIFSPLAKSRVSSGK
ncbi:unnamed protein product [Gulo gulo]|uniref:Uncharacterized protein n=1 Tax=Gulo gulo TaxID=48420 RepID=A0A9X9LYX4_GULGU|nr:unnamed protein product [Gulo gulo]